MCHLYKAAFFYREKYDILFGEQTDDIPMLDVIFACWMTSRVISAVTTYRPRHASSPVALKVPFPAGLSDKIRQTFDRVLVVRKMQIYIFAGTLVLCLRSQRRNV